jgi:hypothetical protein
MFVSDFEQREIGPDLFRAACNMGLEGIVSKRRDRHGAIPKISFGNCDFDHK